MKTRNGIFFADLKSRNDFALNTGIGSNSTAVTLERPAASKSKVNSGFRRWQLLRGAIVPWQASVVTRHCAETAQQEVGDGPRRHPCQLSDADADG
jgi:hypothetical protein